MNYTARVTNFGKLSDICYSAIFMRDVHWLFCTILKTLMYTMTHVAHAPRKRYRKKDLENRLHIFQRSGSRVRHTWNIYGTNWQYIGKIKTVKNDNLLKHVLLCALLWGRLTSAALVFLRVVEWVSDQFFCPTSDFFDFCNPCFFYHTFTNMVHSPILLTNLMQKCVTTVHCRFAILKN